MTKTLSINLTTKKLAAAFTEWNKRFRADPDKFESEASVLLKRTTRSYGEACAPYFTQLLGELETKRPMRKGTAVLLAVDVAVPRLALDDAIVSDPARGLMWTAATLTDKCVNHERATEVAAECRIGGYTDWRLPTIKELQTLVDFDKRKPAIDTALFPDTKSDWYWSSSLLAGDPDYAWCVYFGYGGASYLHRDYNYGIVRAVRSVAPASPGQ